MRRIWRIFCLDVKHATKNVIALIVCVGLVVIPSLYAWFNIAGSWDPYGNTGNLKVAVANTDEGYQSDIIPVKINLGERVASDLSQKTTIGYVVTSEDDAVEGVRSGKYYAAIVIPEDFTKDMLTVFSDDIQQATIVYYSNEKENAIAPIVTDKAATAVKNNIQADFAESLGEVGAGALSEISGHVSDDDLMDISQNLSDAISKASGDLRTVSSHMGIYSSLLSSAGSIIDSSSSLLEGTGSSTEAVRDALSESAEGVREVGDSVDSASAAIDEALTTSQQSFDSVSSAVDEAFDAAETDASDGAAKLRDIATKIDTHVAAYQEFDQSLKDLRDLLPEDAKSLLDPTIARVEGVISTQQSIAEHLRTSAQNLEDGVSSAKEDHEEISSLITQDAQEISDARGTFESDLQTELLDLASSIDNASTASSAVSTKLEETVSDVSDAASLTSGDLSDMKEMLDSSATQVDNMADDLDQLSQKLTDALGSGDAQQVRQILSADPTDLAKFLSEPVGLSRVAIYPIANTGSAMAGFYTTLAIWVGAVVLVAMMKVQVSDAELAEADARPRHAYLGRLLLFGLLGVLQALLVSLGDLFYLGIQCVSPVVFVLSCCLVSVVFVNIMYAFTVSFGDVGKAVCVFLLVIQVAGSGGTFPVEMLPKAFQTLYPTLPFVHSIAVMHECIGGFYGYTWLIEMAILGVYVVLSLTLGLLLRKPVVRLNNWVIEKLESTKIM
ncbi:YhgE/Pip domain-containing protein [Olsenella sp. Marseille-P4559]|uniref:YhgE/Pip domain-containing protein n=1 Tax=Olsenella sp. Marseille-P4559 TaxID=2364795 RepID=UPI0013EF3B46|nr:YhgE/Pip domain-containing protein [Olsenella sp. Marseille-P4559]